MRNSSRDPVPAPSNETVASPLTHIRDGLGRFGFAIIAVALSPFVLPSTALAQQGSGAAAVPPGATSSAPSMAPSIALAKLAPTTGSTVAGTIEFVAAADGSVRVDGQVSGLAPGSTHGFHIHEKGDCSAPDAMSAGGHFNPDGQPHGNPAGHSHHVGDLPNLVADASGVATVSIDSTHLALAGPESIVGRGLIVHKDADDYATQPTGNSGARLACAVITAGPLQSGR